jgi:hypothetical protein
MAGRWQLSSGGQEKWICGKSQSFLRRVFAPQEPFGDSLHAKAQRRCSQHVDSNLRWGSYYRIANVIRLSQKRIRSRLRKMANGWIQETSLPVLRRSDWLHVCTSDAQESAEDREESRTGCPARYSTAMGGPSHVRTEKPNYSVSDSGVNYFPKRAGRVSTSAVRSQCRRVWGPAITALGEERTQTLPISTQHATWYLFFLNRSWRAAWWIH